MTQKAREHLEQLKSQIEKLTLIDRPAIMSVYERAEMLIMRTFDTTKQEQYLAKFAQTALDLNNSTAFADGKRRASYLCDLMIEDLELSQISVNSTTISKTRAPLKLRNGKRISKKIFIVHGHDEVMKLAVARFLEHCGLDPIILHEQPIEGRTIIKKFIDYSDVGYAIVLLSPDDMAYEAIEPPANAKPQARQNVVFELGYFIGKLGDDRVCTLFRKEPEFRMPSDYAGVLVTVQPLLPIYLIFSAPAMLRALKRHSHGCK